MIKNQILISIVMPAYNASLYIEETIQSVLSQTYTCWELLIVNDGSTDDTKDKILNYLSDARIKLINQENQGVAIARNNALAKAKGEYIAFLDADDLWHQTKLEKQVHYLHLFPNLGLVFTDYTCFNKKISNHCLCSDLLIYDKDELPKSLLVKDFIGILTVMIRADVIGKIGVFNPVFFGTEDWDYWIRISHKFHIGFLSEPLAYYRVHALGISKNREKHLIEEFKVIEKHVLNDVALSKKLRALSLLIWQGKKLRYELQMRNYALSFKILKDIIINNFCFPSNYIYFVKVTCITLLKNYKCRCSYSKDI